MDNSHDLGSGTKTGNHADVSPVRENGIQSPMGFAKTASPEGNGATLVVVPPDEPQEHPMPVWMQRTCLIIYVLFCLEVGLMLTLVPWTQAWNHNTYIFSSAWLRSLLQTGFARGVVTGIGLIDIWLGIWEAVQYRDVRPVPKTK